MKFFLNKYEQIMNALVPQISSMCTCTVPLPVFRKRLNGQSQSGMDFIRSGTFDAGSFRVYSLNLPYAIKNLYVGAVGLRKIENFIIGDNEDKTLET